MCVSEPYFEPYETSMLELFYKINKQLQPVEFEIHPWICRSSHQRCSMKKNVLRNSAKFTGKHLCWSLFFNKVAGLRPASLLKKRFWHRCFPVNFAEFLRTCFFIGHLWWLLLDLLTFITAQKIKFFIENICRNLKVTFNLMKYIQAGNTFNVISPVCKQ